MIFPFTVVYGKYYYNYLYYSILFLWLAIKWPLKVRFPPKHYQLFAQVPVNRVGVAGGCDDLRREVVRSSCRMNLNKRINVPLQTW